MKRRRKHLLVAQNIEKEKPTEIDSSPKGKLGVWIKVKQYGSPSLEKVSGIFLIQTWLFLFYFLMPIT